MAIFDLSKFSARLKEFDALRDRDTVKTGIVDCIRPEYANEWPLQLLPSVRDALTGSGISRPYRHQVDAIVKSLSGADVVMESPTASGKTLAFAAPMLDSLVRNKGSHALMIYPRKSLAFDQRMQILPLCKPLSIESWPYDGDTDKEHKKVIRTQPPDILLTNPEYLNDSFLGHREKWDDFLRNLRYVVIDEMHEYRGFFGSNMALLLRRFFLYLNRIGAEPQVFLSTATCANPQEHAKALIGRDVAVVSARNALRPKRHFMFIQPEIPDYRYWEFLRVRVEKASLATLAEGLQTLVFCPTKRFLEEAFGKCQGKAEEYGLDPEQISAFHADLKEDDRQDIQQKIKSGSLRVIFTTNALELGLDIGGLDAVILAGFPTSVMSAWQQIGRAGRGWDKDALVLFYAMNDPIDRFFVGNLDAFLHKPFDQLVIDPDNEKLIDNHLASLIQETGGEFRPDDKPILGSAFYDAAIKDGGKPPKGYRPQPQLKMRGGTGQSFELRLGRKENDRIGRISAERRFREAYLGARFTFFGRRYRVRSHETGAVVLEDADPNLRTEPGFYTVLNTSPSKIFDGFSYGNDDIAVYCGAVNVVTNFTGYKLVNERTGDVVEETRGAAEAHYQNELHAFWIDVPESDAVNAGIGAVEHMIRVGAMFVIPADRFDTSTFSKAKGEPAAYYYENYSGGIGVAKKLFEVWKTTLQKGMEIAKACSCRSGCQNCIEPAKSHNISNAEINKTSGIELAQTLLSAAEEGPNRKFRNGRMVPV
ncbi:MAG: DEAD-box ATP-dependent RNA helicase CshA [Verrucomicrobia subdivision 3 bacterium]|nr:DEAD-box ATP-dependent RNA helicase CshA [Limisphaerales bacterium]MCS1415246.1 DEAD-box ATP-dependent RNA helicase CshA [Limisphaerales bacterium]